jgi:hypothetical protein
MPAILSLAPPQVPCGTCPCCVRMPPPAPLLSNEHQQGLKFLLLFSPSMAPEPSLQRCGTEHLHAPYPDEPKPFQFLSTGTEKRENIPERSKGGQGICPTFCARAQQTAAHRRVSPPGPMRTAHAGLWGTLRVRGKRPGCRGACGRDRPAGTHHLLAQGSSTDPRKKKQGRNPSIRSAWLLILFNFGFSSPPPDV